MQLGKAQKHLWFWTEIHRSVNTKILLDLLLNYLVAIQILQESNWPLCKRKQICLSFRIVKGNLLGWWLKNIQWMLLSFNVNIKEEKLKNNILLIKNQQWCSMCRNKDHRRHFLVHAAPPSPIVVAIPFYCPASLPRVPSTAKAWAAAAPPNRPPGRAEQVGAGAGAAALGCCCHCHHRHCLQPPLLLLEPLGRSCHGRGWPEWQWWQRQHCLFHHPCYCRQQQHHPSRSPLTSSPTIGGGVGGTNSTMSPKAD